MDQDDFERFLAWLDPDHDKAVMKYKEICRRLTKMFESRGFVEAEEMADDTFDRVVRKVPEIADSYVGDPARYFYGVARKVLKEWERRRKLFIPLSGPLPDHRNDRKDIDNKERLDACLEHCMEKLPAEDRRVARLYYEGDGRAKIEQRQKLAEESGGSNALRIRMHRIRAVLKDCISECLKGKEQ
jgi:DNA-directed RNA polymerase specialized sigma24 family protein